MTVMLVPAKGLEGAKSRLASVLSLAARRTLATTMLRQVLAAARTCPLVRRTVVISASQDVAALAAQEGADWMADPHESKGNLKTVIDHGIATLRAETSEGILVVMGDLPYVNSQDLDTLIGELQSRTVVIAPDRHKLGTNALGLAADVDLPTCFGRSDSYAEHLKKTQEHNLLATPVLLPGLALDIDTEADLNLYLAGKSSTEYL